MTARSLALRASLATLLLGAATTAAAAPAGAQLPEPRRGPQLELRGDLIAGRATTVQGALGAGVALGVYARASLVGGAGTTWSGGQSRASARADAVVRFLFDPFGERRWGSYGGAGISALYADAAGDRRWRGYLLAVAGVEGPSKGGFLPSLELGLGGGTRVGLVLRRAPANGR